MREFVGRGTAKKRGFRRSTIARLARFFSSQSLRQAAESDVFWQTVVSVEPAGVEDTYDLTVHTDHNFVANGLVVHNSHSTAYALIAYMTAYLKAHHPLEFMAALLSGDIPHRNFKKKDQLVEHLEDCQRMGITVVPPDVNSSDVDFAVAGGKILFALSAIKGCGGAAAEAIVAARAKQGPFRSLFDFCERVDPAQCNRAAIETLVKAGAFDSSGARRSQLLAVIERALQAGASTLADRRRGQKSLFGGFEEEETTTVSVSLPDTPEQSPRDQLAAEKEVLGFYLSSHPLAEHEETLSTYCSHATADLGALRERTEVILGGIVSSIKTAHTRNPKPGAPSKYANFDLEDKAGAIRCIMWPEDFAKLGHLLVADAILLVRGSLDRRGGGEEANLIASELIPLDQASARYTSGVKIIIDERSHGPDVLGKVREIVRGYPGDRELQMLLCLEDGSRVSLKSHRVRVEVNVEMRRRLDDLLGPGHCQFIAAPPTPSKPPENGRGFRREGAARG